MGQREKITLKGNVVTEEPKVAELYHFSFNYQKLIDSLLNVMNCHVVMHKGKMGHFCLSFAIFHIGSSR